MTICCNILSAAPKKSNLPQTVNRLSVEICQVLSNSCAKISPTNPESQCLVPTTNSMEVLRSPNSTSRTKKEAPGVSDDWTLGHVTCDRVYVCVFSVCLFFLVVGKTTKDTNGGFGTWLSLFRFVVSDVFVFGLFSVIDVCWNPVVDRYVLDFMVYTDILGESQKSAQGGPKNHL